MTRNWIALFVISVWCSYCQATELVFSKGMSRCAIDFDSSYIVPIRGTGHYWVEYIADEKKNINAVLLISSPVPIIDDGNRRSGDSNRCDVQSVLDLVNLPAIKKSGYVDSFDCHILDDMQLPPGELTFGFLRTKSKSGFYYSKMAWQVVVRAERGMASIRRVPIGTRVGCTVLPSID